MNNRKMRNGWQTLCGVKFKYQYLRIVRFIQSMIAAKWNQNAGSRKIGQPNIKTRAKFDFSTVSMNVSPMLDCGISVWSLSSTSTAWGDVRVMVPRCTTRTNQFVCWSIQKKQLAFPAPRHAILYLVGRVLRGPMQSYHQHQWWHAICSTENSQYI